MDDSASNLVGLIREIIREELKNIDKTSICRVESVNIDNTVNLFVLPDRTTVISNILNCSGQNLKSDDIVILFKINNSISNSFIIAKYGPQQTYGEAIVSNNTIISYSGGSSSSPVTPPAPQPTYEEYKGETVPTQMATTATAAHLLKGKTAFSNGTKISGELENYNGEKEPLG